MSSSDWNVKASAQSMNTINPIRKIVDQLKVPTNTNKELIRLSIGDPTVFGNLNPPEHVADLLKDNIKSGKFNGTFAPSLFVVLLCFHFVLFSGTPLLDPFFHIIVLSRCRCRSRVFLIVPLVGHHDSPTHL